MFSLGASVMNVQPPADDVEPAALAAWFGDNHRWFRIGHVAAGLAFLLFYFPFFAGLYERLQRAEGIPTIWSRVMWAGAIISPAAGTTSGAFIVGVALLGSRVSPDVAALGTAGSFYAYVVSGAMTSVILIPAGVVILQTQTLPRSLGWAGTLIGVTAVLGLMSLVEDAPRALFATINGLAWLAYFLWIGALSIALIRIREGAGAS